MRADDHAGRSTGPATEPPQPLGVRSYDELAERLRAMRVWSGASYRDLHRLVVRQRRERGVAELPAYNTVYRCLQPGRRRMDVELVFDVATALLNDRAAAVQWRQACQAVAGRAADASIVPVAGVLPDDLSEFVGRTAQVTEMLAAARGDPTAAQPLVFAIEGMAGVGKTRLAVHVAHRMVEAGLATDARLWVNLRGFDRDQPPADPAAVLDGFLRLLGVPGNQLAQLDLAHRAARFRELLAGRRALVLLDNAAGVDQVVPLLPHSRTCQVIVTSRHRLAGLPAAEHLTLDLFSTPESVELLRRAVGAARIDADRGTAASIAELVGHLPLALALQAGRIRATPDWTLTDHLGRLVERRDASRIDNGVETALELSYDDLAPAQQRLLRLLSLHPGRDFDVCAGAALADLDLAEARRLLADLLAASMLQCAIADRFELHDLVRSYAASRCQDEETPAARGAASTRLFDHYRYLAATAMNLYTPHEGHRRPQIAATGHPVPELGTRERATRWLDTERANLMAVAVHCAAHGWAEHTGDLSVILFRYLDVGGRYQDALTLHGHAGRVAAAPVRGRALAYVSITCITLGRYGPALSCLEEACAIFRDVGDRASEGSSLTILGGAYWRLGRYPEAIEVYEQALVLILEAGDRTAEGHALSNLGMVYALQGRHAKALEVLESALDVIVRIGDTVAECHALTSIAAVLQRQGRYAEALGRVERALAVVRGTGYRLGEADALKELGVIHTCRGAPEQGLKVLGQALAMAREDGVRNLELQVLNAVGMALQRLGRHRDATEQHRDALAMATALGDRYELAGAYDGLGTALAALRETRAARSSWREAHALYDQLGAPEAAAVASRLHMLEGSHVDQADGARSPGR